MRKKMKKIVIILAFFGILIYSCVMDCGCAIFVLNNSNHTIYVYNAYDEDFLSMSRKLELLWRYDDNETYYPPYRAAPDSMAGITFSGKHNDIFNLYLKDGELRLFIIREDSLLKYTWNEICEKQLYEKKLIVTEKELEENNWTIVYE